jgi:hypothetical protein
MFIMKKPYLYLIVVLAVLVVAVLGWYYFSTQAAYLTNWKCTNSYTKTKADCPSGTYTAFCYGGSLFCTGPINTTMSCTNFYVPSCPSPYILTCTKTSYQCSIYNPGNCTAVGTCGGGGGGGGGRPPLMT